MSNKNTKTKKKTQTRQVSSYNTKKVRHTRRILFLANTFILFNLFVIPSVIFVSNRVNQNIDAQTSYRPPYDPVAVFNTPIPDNYPTDPKSSAIISRISTDFNRIAVTHVGEVPTVYNVNNGMTKYTVTWPYSGTVSFPVSSDVQPGGGSDHPLILLNTDTQVELRLWQASVNHSTKKITASYGGQFYYNNDGRILNPNGTRSTSIPFSGVGTGSGLSYLAGLVTNEDFESGVIRHAIRFANSCTTSTATFRPPATRTDQPHPQCNGTPNPNASSSIEMGSILQLDKSIDCNARTVPSKPNTSKETRLLRMVCKAMQDYGIIMLDGTGAGGSANFYLEDNRTAQWNLDEAGRGNYGWIFRPPYSSSDGIQRNGTTDGIPFNKFRVTARPVSNISWGAGTPVSGGSSTVPGGSTNTNTGSTPTTSSGGTPQQPNNQNSTNTNPQNNVVQIPADVIKKEDGTLISDFNGDTVPDVAIDSNNDGLISPENEILIDGATNPEQVNNTAGQKLINEQTKEPELQTTLSIGPLKTSASITKIITVSLGSLVGAGLLTLSAYTAITHIPALYPLRMRLGL